MKTIGNLIRSKNFHKVKKEMDEQIKLKYKRNEQEIKNLGKMFWTWKDIEGELGMVHKEVRSTIRRGRKINYEQKTS